MKKFWGWINSNKVLGRASALCVITNLGFLISLLFGYEPSKLSIGFNYAALAIFFASTAIEYLKPKGE
jgi:hypothetical protein